MDSGIGSLYANIYGIVLFVIAIVLVFKSQGTTASLPGSSGLVRGAGSIALTMFRGIVGTIPWILLAYGPVLDLISPQYRYTIASVIGISAMAVAYLASFVFKSFLPSLIISSASILTYFSYDYLVKQRDYSCIAVGSSVSTIVMFVTSFIVLLLQALGTAPAVPGTYAFGSSFMNDGVAALFGASMGLFGWLTVYVVSPDLLPYNGKNGLAVTIPQCGADGSADTSAATQQSINFNPVGKSLATAYNTTGSGLSSAYNKAGADLSSAYSNIAGSNTPAIPVPVPTTGASVPTAPVATPSS